MTPTPSTPERDMSKAVVTCARCQGNGEIVTDWVRYMRGQEDENGNEAVAECPDCGGEGILEAFLSHGAEAVEPAFLHKLVENAFSWGKQDCNYLNPKHIDAFVEATKKGMAPEQAARWVADRLPEKAEAVEPEQKPLIWSNNEARTEEGNLYEVIQMSERVCTTYLNGTAFPRWKPTLDEAKAVAQSDYDTRRASPVRSAQEAVSDLDIQIAYEAWIDRTIGARAPITAFYAGYRAALLPPGGETATPDSGRTE